MTIKRPMLAVAGGTAIKYPCLASAKLDGIRALTHPELGLVSRTFKPIRNEYIRRFLNYTECQCLDGELITYNGDGTTRTFSEVSGDVMRKAGEPRFVFHVFDDFSDPTLPFEQRYLHLFDRVSTGMPGVQYVRHHIITNGDELIALRDKYMDLGYEGLMTRDLSGPYKEGRSTEKQGWLLKHKCWHDDEAAITGFEELMINGNDATTGEVGQTKRSTAKSGLVPGATLGALVVNHPTYGEFKLGTGFDTDLRQFIWNNRPSIEGQLVKFKCQLEGAKDKPRFPVFLGFRHEDDL